MPAFRTLQYSSKTGINCSRVALLRCAGGNGVADEDQRIDHDPSFEPRCSPPVASLPSAGNDVAFLARMRSKRNSSFPTKHPRWLSLARGALGGGNIVAKHGAGGRIRWASFMERAWPTGAVEPFTDVLVVVLDSLFEEYYFSGSGVVQSGSSEALHGLIPWGFAFRLSAPRWKAPFVFSLV
jgi:hypothetical protein